MTPEQIVSIILASNPVFLLVKGAVILLLLVYTVFAVILVRQVTIMMQVVEVPIAPLFRVLLILHLLLDLAVVLFAFIII